MRLAGEHHFRSGRADVWRALQDPQVLTNALPGVRRLEVQDDDRFKVTVTVGVGAIKGAYDGAFWLSDKQDLASCRVQAEASGPPGSIAMTAAMQLRDGDAGGTVLSYDADAMVTGPLAGVGQRMVVAAAKKTTAEFLAAIDRELSSGPVPAATAPTGPDHRPGDDAQAGPSGTGPAGVFVPAATEGRGGDAELRLFAGGLLCGFALAVIGILIGRGLRTPRDGAWR